MLPASSKGGGQAFGFPDTCKMPPQGIPAPLPNIGMVNQVTKESTVVKVSGTGAVTKKSEMPRSMGDEPGTLGGVKSNQNMGKVVYDSESKVKVEGQSVQYLTSKTAHNGMSANMPAGMQVAPSQVKVLVGQ